MPAVSVVIPTYGHAKYVCHAVESALSQTFRDFEVIVVNDGSPDNTATVLRPYVIERRIRYVEQENLGQASARNRGIAEASGRWIAFLDDDDIWPANKLAWQVGALDQDATIGVIGGAADLIDGDGSAIGRSPVPNGLLGLPVMLLGNPFLSPGQVVIRRDLLTRSGGLRSGFGGADDYDLWLRLSRMTKVVGIDRTALLYRRHSGNASRHAAKLLANTERVVRSHIRHLPVASRKAIQQSAYRGQYWWLGQGFVRGVRTAIGRGDLAGSVTCARAMAPLARAILRDTFLAKQVMSDLLRRS